MPPTVIKIPGTSLAGARPQTIPGRGNQRIVKLVETPFGWGHALWTSPYTVDDPDLKTQCRVCVTLVTTGPPKPEICTMTIPTSVLDAYPEDVVDW
jgi:hypothetical protein